MASRLRYSPKSQVLARAGEVHPGPMARQGGRPALPRQRGLATL